MRSAIITCLCLHCVSLANAQQRLVYRQQTAKEIVRIEIWEERDGNGLLLQSSWSNGESYSVQNDFDLATSSFTYGNTGQKTSYAESREGNTIRLEGMLKGRPFSRLSRIDDLPVYEVVERSLQGFAISGSARTIYFWMVLPTEARVFRLKARREGRQVVNVAGQPVEAERVKVTLTGIASFIWSSVYWYRPVDGTFLRSESVRGFIGTPKTVIELVEGTRL